MTIFNKKESAALIQAFRKAWDEVYFENEEAARKRRFAPLSLAISVGKKTISNRVEDLHSIIKTHPHVSVALPNHLLCEISRAKNGAPVVAVYYLNSVYESVINLGTGLNSVSWRYIPNENYKALHKNFIQPFVDGVTCEKGRVGDFFENDAYRFKSGEDATAFIKKLHAFEHNPDVISFEYFYPIHRQFWDALKKARKERAKLALH